MYSVSEGLRAEAYWGAPHLRVGTILQVLTSSVPLGHWLRVLQGHQSQPGNLISPCPSTGDKRTQQDGQGGHHWLPLFLIHPGFRFSAPIHPTSRAGEAGGGATLMDFCHVSNWGCHLSKSSNYTNCTIPFASAAVTPWGLGVQEAVSSPQGLPPADKES